MRSQITKLLCVAVLLVTAANTDHAIVKGAELKRLIVGSRVTSDPTRKSIETFEIDGHYRHLFSTLVEQGTYEIEGHNVCTYTPRKVCKRIVRNKQGRLFYISSTDTLNRPWPIKIERLEKGK